MSKLREWLSRLRGTLGRGRAGGDMEEELRAHLELATEAAQRSGRTPEEAARAARLRAGRIPQAVEELRDQRGLPWVDDLIHDCRYGFRLLRRSPLFACAAVLSLALGIGANTAIFSFLLSHPTS